MTMWGPPENVNGKTVRRGVSTGTEAQTHEPDAIAVRVILAMRAADMTQAELAYAAGMTPDKLSKCFHGKRRFSSLEVALIAEATKASVESLLGMQINVYGWRQGYSEAIADALRAFEAGRIAHFLAEYEPTEPDEGVTRAKIDAARGRCDEHGHIGHSAELPCYWCSVPQPMDGES